MRNLRQVVQLLIMDVVHIQSDGAIDVPGRRVWFKLSRQEGVMRFLAEGPDDFIVNKRSKCYYLFVDV